MLIQTPFLPKTLNPTLHLFFPIPNLTPKTLKSKKFKPITCSQSFPNPQISRQNAPSRPDFRSFAGRSKKKPGGSSGGRIEGNAEVRREAKRNARRKSKQLAESLFYRLKNPNKNHPDNFTDEELQMIGLGYDRMVQFMDRDDPNLRHPNDWYKYGEFGPYSWRGVVVGDPIRGRFSDERVSIIGNVRDHEEWEEIEKFEMASEFGKRWDQLDKDVGFRYFWVFVRHPKWNVSDLPWQQWTLVGEVVVEHGKQWLDKWSLMGRFGNKTRQLITKCAAWMRPDIIYVKRPVYQCRFEPQENFFKALMPFLNPETERNYLFELENEDGSVEWCTYFAGLCKIVRVNPKAFVDDVVKAYDRMSDERKSKCLGFLLTNHPMQLLHPFTKEWKAKLEEEELGCDAPDEDEDEFRRKSSKNEMIDWMEDDGDENEEDDEDNVIDGQEEDDDDEDDDANMEEGEEDDSSDEEDESKWDDKFKKTLSSAEAMEDLARRSMEFREELYRREMEGVNRKETVADDGDETQLRGKRAKVSPEEWKLIGYGPWRKKIKKSKIPPELFLRAAVRPFTYRNLVKEIVLTRHAILEGDIGTKA